MEKVLITFSLLLLVAGPTLCDNTNQNNLNSLLQQDLAKLGPEGKQFMEQFGKEGMDFSNLGNMLPPGGFGGNSSGPGGIDQQQMDKAMMQLQEKCKNVSGSDETAQHLIMGVQTLTVCLQDLVNTTALNIEIDANSKNGSLDVVFNKYCKRRHTALDCLETFSNLTETCLTKDEIAKKNLIFEFVKVMFDFVCHKDGDHIALFIAERGPECFENRSDALRECGEKTFAKYMPSNPDDVTTSDIFKAKCDDLDPLQKCAVHELEKCNNTTPGNLVDSMFKAIKKECYKQLEPERLTNLGSSFTTPTMLLGTILMALFAKFLTNV